MDAGDFIATWQGNAGGRERSNFPVFIGGLCEVLGVDPPRGPAEKGKLGVYEYEAPIRNASVRVAKQSGQTGFADLYKKGHFLLEAKQSYLKEGQSEPVRSDGSSYDQLMRGAYLQAHNYAANIDSDHPNVPFLIVCDIGRAFEVYFDWAGNGRGFEPFPDTQSYRITLDQLADENIRARLKGIWTNPDAIDPRRVAADVTRAVAVRLALVSESLEGKIRRNTDLTQSQRAEETQAAALFLMRILFCMFAEDVKLLPEKSFQNFLEASLENERGFERGLADLWTNMGQANRADRYAYAVETAVPYFNGGLFRDHRTFPLITGDRNLLLEASKAVWTNVEPAIFGTMLEKALGAERDKLGAHYTPRKYVEFLVRKTFIDDLEDEWAAIEELAQSDAASAVIAQAEEFHDKLAGLKILDPACGTGNFLYVSMELMLNIEARLIRLVRDLGGAASQRIDPRQFFGLELNTGAAKITELVLWIGWLRKRMADPGSGVPDPVLATLETINLGFLDRFDSVVRHKIETVTVEGSDRTQFYLGDVDSGNPGVPDWPEADYIVGNPPFIGAKYLRENLGDDYAEALWAANPDVGRSADLVMYWWNHAARILTTPGTRLKRFGLVTTNSITQEFSRRVIAGYLAPKSSPSLLGEGDRPQGGGGAADVVGGKQQQEQDATASPSHPSTASRSPSPSKLGEDCKQGLSIILAVPDHPWHKLVRDEKVRGVKRQGEASLKQAKKAAVRIAMTVAEAGAGRPGRLFEVAGEAGLDTDNPEVTFFDPAGTLGVINADLSIGADVTKAMPLMAHLGLSSPGVKLHGDGFIVAPDFAREKLGMGSRAGLEAHIRPYRNGRDLMQHSRGKWVIDLFGLTEVEVMERFPEVYDHLAETVKPERDVNNRESYKRNWWIFGEPRGDLRPALSGLPRYIVTVVTAKHRLFTMLDSRILPDDALIAVALYDAFFLGVLSSRIHVEWSIRTGGWLGVGNDSRYNKSKVFDPFPFPDASPAQRAEIADLAERLDAQRKAALAENPSLTMTEIYNLRTAIQRGEPVDRDRAAKARARAVGELHEKLDSAVAAAYGWPESPSASLAPAEIVARLVALNAERAAEEANGMIRWLRPEYQNPAG